MRIKILMVGNNPAALVADEQLLRDRDMLVYTAFNLENIPEMITEVKPNIIFFNSPKSNPVTETYNSIVNSIYFKDIPVIFTLSEDDIYLVTRKRTETGEKKKLTANNIIDAIKMALTVGNTPHYKHYVTKENQLQPHAVQLPVFSGSNY